MTTILNLFKFIESKRKQYLIPLKLKLINNLPLTKEELNADGNLYLGDTPIQSLPDNLSVKGDLDLRRTPIESLPNNLTVDGHLNLYNTPIQSLPNNLKVGINLNLYHTPLSKKYTEEQIRKMIEDNGGSLNGGQIFM